MAKQSLMWTALPNGVAADGSLRVSALLSPRLTPDADQILKPFSDLTDWPDTIRHSKFTIHYGAQSIGISGNQFAAHARVDNTIDVADSPTWTALFHKDTYVAGYVFVDHSTDRVMSYDTVAVHSLAQTLYSNLGRSTSDALPKISQILGDPDWQGLIDAVSAIDRGSTSDKTNLRDVDLQIARSKTKFTSATR